MATGLKALTVLVGRMTHEHYHLIRVGVLWAVGRTTLRCAVLAVTRWEKYGAFISVLA